MEYLSRITQHGFYNFGHFKQLSKSASKPKSMS